MNDNWGELDKDAERTEEATSRLAVCNMDWDRVDAQDIFLVSSTTSSRSNFLTKNIHFVI